MPSSETIESESIKSEAIQATQKGPDSSRSSIALIERYKEYLPVSEQTPILSLGEGNTPLIEAVNIPRLFGRTDLKLYFKFEGLNPTGSFKDRGMTLAVSKALEAGSKSIICASTGNTSASAAAFAARAGITCYVLLPYGKVAAGKLAQALIYGAKIITVDGNFDVALDMVRLLGESHPITIVNSINPFRLEGQKTAAFEVIETLGESPDFLFIPVGNAGNISAYWRGFKQFKELGKVDKTPKMFGYEALGAAAIVQGKKIDNPETIATAIRIGNPASWQEAERAAKESNGRIDSITDDEILEAYKLVASKEGVFCEPSSAASVAGWIKALKADDIAHGSTCVCVLTGNGLKDPDMPVKMVPLEMKPTAPTLQKLTEVMGL